MVKKLTKLIMIFLIGAILPLQATHLVGGEITYKCLGNGDYEVTLIIYRDCTTASTLDADAAVTVYDQFNNIIANQRLPRINILTLPLEAPNNCTSLPNNLCTEKGIYRGTFNLPPAMGGYTISHQRCCRNATITNINNQNTIWGSTYTTSIASMDNCNSSPKFVSDPPVVLCVNQDVTLDLSASDDNGDSLYYELCSVLHGGAKTPNTAIAPDPAAPPPYTVVPFIGGYSTSYPIASAPAFSIDPATGVIQGKPNQVGQFVFAICVSEYKNGVKLSTTRRDFQFNVSSACQTIISEIEEQFLNPVNMCSGGRIDFTNLSKKANTFWWDFGDTTTLLDTSRNRNPSYVYPDTGTYYVTLVAGPYLPCADTTVAEFVVYEAPKISFSHRGVYCLEDNIVDFFTWGDYSENATFQWDFDGSVSSGDPTAESPKGIRWDAPGVYYVTVEVNDFECEGSFGDTVIITENPVIDEIVPVVSECAPYTVEFKDETDAYGVVQHYWYFGDGNVSYDASPEHTYKKPGTYSVQHMIKTTEGCIDSGYSSYENIINIFPVPQSGIEVFPKEQSIYEPEFTLINKSNGHNYSETILPDARVIQNLTEEKIIMEDSGTYEIKHISFNEYGCTDTIVDSITVLTPFNLFVPNAFTPDGDGVNDRFSFTATDVRSIKLEIYNRWGEAVFSSTDLDAEWNGRLDNTGERLPGGTYAYVLIARVKKGSYDYTKRGVIHLIR